MADSNPPASPPRPPTRDETADSQSGDVAQARSSVAEYRPPVIGRFHTRGQLGRGGQGVVFEAWDPQLKRSLAIKLLRADPTQDQQILREAEAAARVSSPHVVSIYDVDTWNGRVFLAMEFIPGGTLTEWAAAKKRTVPEILAKCLEAGRGLERIHEQGLVHRDFKPDNVLLKENGTATVSDFGLSRFANDDATSRAGTRRFMAPELTQFGNASPASDQFAFCVSLYLLLTGDYPPPVEGELVALPAGQVMPTWVRRVLTRGLAPSPTERFASMGELLAELENDPVVRARARLRQALIIGAVAVAALATTVLLLRESPEEQAHRECLERADALTEELWSPRRVAALQTHFTSLAGTLGTQSFEKVRSRLEPQVNALVQASRQACDVSEPLARANVNSCLLGRTAVLRTTGDALATLDKSELPNVLYTLSLALKPVEACQSAAPVPSTLAETDADRELRVDLAPVTVLRAAGRLDEARRLAIDVAHRAEARGAPWARAEALLAAGQVLADQRHATAAEELERAIVAADGVGADELRARGWISLMSVRIAREEFPEAGLARKSAASIVQRVGSPALLLGSLLNEEGNLLYALGELGPAEAKFNEYRALLLQSRPGNDPLVRHAEANILLSGAVERQVAGFEALVAATEAELGPSHPETLFTRHNLAAALLNNHQCARALEEVSRVIATREAGPNWLQSPLSGNYGLRARVYECLGQPLAALEDEGHSVERLRRSAPDAVLHRELTWAFETGRTAGAPREWLRQLVDEVCTLGFPSPDDTWKCSP